MTDDNNSGDGRKRKPTGAYEVGFAKPPKEHQFKLGQKGNPKGRPPGSKNINPFTKALSEKITIVENGKRRRVTVEDALTMKFIRHALKDENSKDYERVMKIKAMLEKATREKPPSKEEILREAKEQEMKKKLSAELAKFYTELLESYSQNMGILEEVEPGRFRPVKWIRDARALRHREEQRALREKMLPGSTANWPPFKPAED